MTLPDLPDELDELKQRIAADPDDLEAREQLADLLLDMGETAGGLGQLYTASERLGDDGQFERAIALLSKLLAHDPEHDNAQKLLRRLYVRVPRFPDTERAPRDRGLSTATDPLGDALFGLPKESAEVLARILPFDEEDPPPTAGLIVIRVPAGPAESAQPFLAQLDKELRRSGGEPFERRPSDPRDPRLSGDRPAPPPVPSVASAHEITPDVRISPASKAISIDSLPPNPIIDMLDSERLERLLGAVDLLRFGPNDVVFESWTPRGLFIVVGGTLHVRRETESQGPQIVDVLQPGDFFGEFELLTVMATSAQIVAANAGDVLEIPESVISELADEMPEIVDLLWDTYFNRAFHSMMATSEIFSQLAVDAIQRIAVELEPLVFETGDIVLREGQAPRGLYGVVGGNLAVVRPSRTASEVVTRLGPGDFFGLVSSASGEPSRASVVATEATTLLWLARPAMASLRETVPAFARILRDASSDRMWRYKLSVTG